MMGQGAFYFFLPETIKWEETRNQKSLFSIEELSFLIPKPVING